MIGSAQSAHLVDSVILSRHTACLAPPNVTILRMYISSESHFLPPAKRLSLRMPSTGPPASLETLHVVLWHLEYRCGQRTSESFHFATGSRTNF